MLRSLMIKLALLPCALLLAFYTHDFLQENATPQKISEPGDGNFVSLVALASASKEELHGTSAGTESDRVKAKVVDLNRANLEDLITLPGVGTVLAQRILAFRANSGEFSTIDDLRQVNGIGEKRLNQLRPWLTVRK